jgi:CheY-like chemotaxis protein
MEAIGQLAGGIAHDFNNLLTGITGNISLALLRLGDDHPLSDKLREIAGIAQRAANLTRQLLAFSRRQIIEPRVIDLSATIADLEGMLRRVIGEMVELEVSTEEGLGRVKVDPGQIEQIIVNLCVNARDAMIEGGVLAIRTANVELDEAYSESHPDVEPGPYVMMSVSDTGCGMDAETQSHIFEPFFTTKPKDKGTGLGLSTVYGAVKQNRGSIEVCSEPDRGTTFKIYFPRIDEAVSRSSGSIPKVELPSGSETVLFVEDEVTVREAAIDILEYLGYRVLQAPNGIEALAVAEAHEGPIDLLMTDVIMPGMTGHELAGRLVQQYPELKVLFSSGYTSDVIGHHGVLDEGVNFISKPFTPQTLAGKLREVLDEPDEEA